MNGGFYVGCKIVIMPKFDMIPFLELIQKHKVTYIHLAPPVALGLVKHPAVSKYDLSSVTKIVSGAAPLSAELESQLKQKLGSHVTVKQGYGMTGKISENLSNNLLETSPVSHFTVLNYHKPGSVGWLFPNMEAKIVDLSTKQALPINKEGELCVRGPNVMLGYLNNPNATKNTIDKDGFLHTVRFGIELC
jgi:acyl-CoA synthetase (AMP-forming)/AMP-acid ligase II